MDGVILIDQYKQIENEKNKVLLGAEENTVNNEFPFINPEFSSICQGKMKNGESVLSDMKEHYPEYVPQLDRDFILVFFDYVNNEGPDFSELLEVFIIHNIESLLYCGLMKLLFSKVPNSFNHIYLALKYGNEQAFDYFDEEYGFYIITSYSSESQFNLAISQILMLTISKINDFINFQCPIQFEDLLSSDSKTNYPDLGSPQLIKNLLDSNNNEVILNTLKALKISFKGSINSRVILGNVFMAYFEEFIQSTIFSEETVYVFAAGIDGIPLIEERKDRILDISYNLLIHDDYKLVLSGIKLSKEIAKHKFKSIEVCPNQSPLDIFNEIPIIPLIFKIAQNGSYKQKITSLEAIDAFIEYSISKDLQIFIECGIFPILGSIFANEDGESIADKSIIYICIKILKNMSIKGILNRAQEDDLIQMIDLFKYVEVLRYNEDENIANEATEAYKILDIYYRPLLVKAEEIE